VQRRFTWDQDKNLRNQSKHGVSFEAAVHVFYDPLHTTVQDRIEDGEPRWQTIGVVENVVVILVAHTVSDALDEEGETIRIISARKATRRERKHYENS